MGLEEKAQDREIGDVVYRVWPVPFGVGRPALMRLIGIISPLAAAYLKQTGERASVAALLEALPVALSDDDVKYFSELLGRASKYQDGANWPALIPANQDTHFAGRYLEFTKWLIFAIEVNFSGFFVGMKDGAGLTDLLKTMQSPSKSTAGTG